LNTDLLDVLATDHAPHTNEEKNQVYTKAPSGGPLVQHALPALLTAYHQGKITLKKIVQKACHNPALLFDVIDRGYIREGYYADLVILDLNKEFEVTKNDILYQCGWSPFEEPSLKDMLKQLCSTDNGRILKDRFILSQQP
jgi:dihydroorotase